MSKGPQRIGDILPQLMAQKGFARVQGAAQYTAAWTEAAGALAARYSRVGGLRRGTLEVIVANSAIIQEFVFQKESILETLNRLLPDQGIKDIRFRLGAIS
jgi:predicted nucleic acid-binding Zn ribbon protein